MSSGRDPLRVLYPAPYNFFHAVAPQVPPFLKRIDSWFRRGQLRADLLFRTSAEAAMSWMYIVSGVLAVAILVYLVVALLYPEKF
jgi:K+-transporting ATPase KdpF subunit